MRHIFFLKKQCRLLFLYVFFFCLIFPIDIRAQEAGAVYEAAAYHRHGDRCYTTESCGGTCYEDTYMTQGCSCGMDHPCGSHGCYWEEPNDRYPSGCWHCYCPKAKQWLCPKCYKVSNGPSCSQEERRLSCGRSESDKTAAVIVEKSTEEWCEELTLTAMAEVFGAEMADAPYVWNGTATQESSYTVRENGSVSFALQTKDSGQAQLSVPVTNIDVTAPAIQAVEWEQDGWLTAAAVTVEAKDLQPEGGEGCGLAEEAYSFDGGMTWTADPVYQMEENGILSIQVKDRMGHVAQKEVTISNLDNDPPQAALTASPAEWDGTGEITLTVEAYDAGSGLAKEPYSWDEGQTFTHEAVGQVQAAGTYQVLVRDQNGNEVRCTCTVNNKPQPKPEPDSGSHNNDSSGEGSSHDSNSSDNGSGGSVSGWEQGDTDSTGQSTEENKEKDDTAETAPNPDTAETELAGQGTELSEPDSQRNGGSGHSQTAEKDREDSREYGKAAKILLKKQQDRSAAEQIMLTEMTDWQENAARDRIALAATQWAAEGMTGGQGGDTDGGAAGQDSGDTEEETGQDGMTALSDGAGSGDSNFLWPLGSWIGTKFLQGRAVKATVAAASGALLLSVSALFLYFLFLGVRVYNDNGDNRFVFLGRCICRRQEDHFLLTVPEGMLERAYTNRWRICPGWLFAQLNCGEEMLVEMKGTEGKISVMIDKKAEFRL